MKKRLAILVITAVVLMSAVFTPAATETNFNDRSDIGAAYTEAVDAMAALGVIIGFPGNLYYPQLALTREQGAKSITYIILGQKAADALECTDHVYSDVKEDDWSAPSIQWCTAHEIILGYGDNRFGPKNPLTGYQFAKMLLCALELGKQERYVGDTWKDRVAEDCERFKLLKGDKDMLSDEPLKREQAALMAYNAILSSDLAYLLDSGDSGSTGTRDTRDTRDTVWTLPIEPDTDDTGNKPDESLPDDSQNPDTKESETQQSETQESETQESETQESETQESETQESETKESETKESETQNYETGIVLPEVP